MLVASGLVKHYGGVTALDGVGITLDAGEVHALVGENGAGKSTLVKVISGVVRPEGGTVELDGFPVRFADARRAAAQGVAIVSQELMTYDDLTVLENLFPYGAPRRGGLVSTREMRRLAGPVLAELGLDPPPHAKVGELPLADRQLLEICRALLQDPRVLILDEPTSALPRDAAARLAAVTRRLAARGARGPVHLALPGRGDAGRDPGHRPAGRPGRARGRAAADVGLDSLVAAMLGQAARRADPADAAAPRRSGGAAVALARRHRPGTPARGVPDGPGRGDRRAGGPAGLGASRRSRRRVRPGASLVRFRPAAGRAVAPFRPARRHRGRRLHLRRPQGPRADARQDALGEHHIGELARAGAWRADAPPRTPGRTFPRPSGEAEGPRGRPRPRRATCRAGTSRRWSSPSGWTPIRPSSPWTIPRGAWTWALAASCTASSESSPVRGRWCSSPPATSRNWSSCATASSSSSTAGSSPRWTATGSPNRS
ncbi:ATP-binding cassette domain-containing protein [Actinomadura madurae]|nr:ATP-binding cassette domain-containing protein [Actinomadura madurae]MCP9972592.1 ATP-binding cassette domain-containing protein [Actinomadura madurae]